MNFRAIFLVLSILFSCTADYAEIRKINRESLFHDNSSKIWVINKVLKKGVNYAALKLKNKDVIIFYSSGRILIQPLKTLGTFPSKTGTLNISSDSKSCAFLFPKEKWTFKTIKISSSQIKLKSKISSAFDFDLELITYPDSESLKLD